ncbi:hypothetical protein C8J57DRAFT_1514351 [Mycena rebaudengoi]|nr:hypothetical protein C8J57DRAFT_1514351 [Mycena rebaudengoi]
MRTTRRDADDALRCGHAARCGRHPAMSPLARDTVDMRDAHDPSRSRQTNVTLRAVWTKRRCLKMRTKRLDAGKGAMGTFRWRMTRRAKMRTTPRNTDETSGADDMPYADRTSRPRRQAAMRTPRSMRHAAPDAAGTSLWRHAARCGPHRMTCQHAGSGRPLSQCDIPPYARHAARYTDALSRWGRNGAMSTSR